MVQHRKPRPANQRDCGIHIGTDSPEVERVSKPMLVASTA